MVLMHKYVHVNAEFGVYLRRFRHAHYNIKHCGENKAADEMSWLKTIYFIIQTTLHGHSKSLSTDTKLCIDKAIFNLLKGLG